MDHNDQNIQNEDLVNDDIAAQLAGVQNTEGADQTQQPMTTNKPMATFSPPIDDEVGDTDALAAAPNLQPGNSMPSDLGITTPEPVVETPAEEAVVVPEPMPEPEPVEDLVIAEPSFVTPEPAVTTEENTPDDSSQNTDNSDAEPTKPVIDSELSDIKKHALEELTPLVDRLDLSPEKRYDILMEMVQASGDQTLIAQAYEAAKSIDSDDLKAQALMEVVNEIDYLSRPNSN